MNTNIQLNTPTQTDFYQFTMSYAYLIAGIANQTTGFEAFIRHIKPAVAGDNKFYIFKGEQDVHNFMRIVKKEFNSPDFFDQFWEIFNPKFKERNKVGIYYLMAKKAFDEMDKDFEYTVVPDGTKVYPMVPVFQFKGSKMIGQMIETPITNIVNGQTGQESFKTFFPDEFDAIEKIDNIMNGVVPPDYNEMLEERAKEYRAATTKILLEAGFRRSPNFALAYAASMIAIENGWDGTSNTSLFGAIDIEKIGGTMAHAFIMAFKNEIDAFKAWDAIFPGSTMLIDTYDSVNAVKMLIENNIRPVAVRIDSDPIEKIAREVRAILDDAGWTEVKIFLSGDITPEKLIQWEKDDVPFDMVMAGTKYVNLDVMANVNSGFVYKIVEYEEDGRRYFPYKKAFGKSNYPGLKTVTVDPDGDITMTINGKIGFNNIENINDDAYMEFMSRIDFSKDVETNSCEVA